MTGHRLLHYQILEKLGQGGMGIVYRAQDTTLNRQVAIKVLPDMFSRDPERLARFEREARLLASLNHPHIATIYGLEQANGRRFIVMELAEGETLAQKISRGPLPVEDALAVCRQIAEALEAAHENGIIHRDLKPSNIVVSAEGKIKILDFGLARALAGEAADPSDSPTITHEMTRPGVLLGTAAYMSPEQARGKTVDKRADIWAFGCILYECLTGKRAFAGETITDIVATVLKSEPEWALLPVDTPLLVRTVLRQCLQKDPARRLRDIGDAFLGMNESAIPPSELVALPRRFSRWWIAGLVAIWAIAATLVTIAFMRHFQGAPSPAPSPLVTRSIIRIEPGQWLAGVTRKAEFWQPSRTAMAISRDGRFIVYSAIEGDPGPQAIPRLYRRWTDQLEAKPITGTDGGINPFLSPDNRWVGFWSGGKLMKVSIDGGVPAPFCDSASSFGASWGPDSSIVFSSDEDVGISRVPADGGKPEVLTTPDKTSDEKSHRLPHILPNGKNALFTIMKEAYDAHPRIAILNLETKKKTPLMEDAVDARYVSTGHLVFLRRGILMAVPFDLHGLKEAGQPVPVVENVMQAINSANSNFNTEAGQFSVSDSGWLIYVPGGAVNGYENSLVWVDQQGNPQPITSFKAAFIIPRLSSDGQRIAYNFIGSEWRLDIYDLLRATATPWTSEGRSLFSTWTPNGKRVIFSWWKSGVANLYWQHADGSSPMERLTTSEYFQFPASVTPDEATLAFVEVRPDHTSYHLLLLDLQSRQVTSFSNSTFNECCPMFSPDGRWLAYSSNESGKDEVYVRLYPGGGGKSKISLDGGTDPLWARDGKQLFYRRQDQVQDQVWVVDVQTDQGFSKPRLLFEKPGPVYRIGGVVPFWDISLDGQRFLMVKSDDRKATPVTEMILVQNWFEELKRLVPSGIKP
jgi:predicted Ser/Thr protein kinase